MWTQKKLEVQGTMTPQCALQMRSTFGTDILIQETGLLDNGNQVATHISKHIRKDDQKVTCVYENSVEHEDALLWKTDTKGKQSQVRTYEQEVCESWFLVDSVTILEGARAIGTPGYEEEELNGMWEEIM